MSYNFYDFNNAMQQRNEFVEDRLRDGSPVVAVCYDQGVLILTLRGTQRKVFEVFDRLMMGALGRQSDVEAIRLAAIDAAHREGFQRSEDDVSIQRLVGFGLSPAIKRVYNDPQQVPLTLRTIFAEVNAAPQDDQLFLLGYDGEFKTLSGAAIAGGSAFAEDQGTKILTPAVGKPLAEALDAALNAWATTRLQLAPPPEKIDDDFDEESQPEKTTLDAFRDAETGGWKIEAGILERNVARTSRFRLLTEEETEAARAKFLKGA